MPESLQIGFVAAIVLADSGRTLACQRPPGAAGLGPARPVGCRFQVRLVDALQRSARH
jgi:hypothetical protein